VTLWESLPTLKKKLADYKAKEQERRDAEKLTLPVDIERRRAEREARKDEIRETLERSSETDQMRRRWAREDDARSKQAADDETYDREKKWARQDAKKEAIRRERERYREGRALRIEELAVKEKVRENDWKAQQERDAFDSEQWQKQAAAKKREINRAIRNANDQNKLELTDDPYTYLAFLQPSSKRNGREFRRRMVETEKANDEMKQWYLDRDFDRGETKIRANRTIHTYARK